MLDRPRNLLIVISDEHRRDAMGCMGHPIVRTPVLDALAARGAVFENAYTPSPICVPARAALACGDFVHRIGCWDSAAPYDGRQRSWMHTLRDGGVETVSIGKLHFRSCEDDNGFCEEILPMHVAGDGWTLGLLRENPPPFEAAAELAAEVGSGETAYTGYDRAITEAAEAWLRARGADPWAAIVSFVSPHYPLQAPDDFYRLYDPAQMDLPVAYRPEERPDHPELRANAAFWDYDRHFDEDRVRQAKAAYYGLISFMDDCVGRVLATLEAVGQAEETLILYFSDHGDMMGDHGFWTKQVMYEASAGVPMIAAGPGVRANRRVATAVSLLDVAPTALDVFGIDDPRYGPGLPGRSLSALAAEPDDPGRAVFSEYHDGGSRTGVFMLRWDRWKYVHYAGGTPQLFDLHDDPLELRDLADEPGMGAILSEGRNRLGVICDPEAVNARCFAEQRRRIEALGGAEACRTAGAFNHTPTPV